MRNAILTCIISIGTAVSLVAVGMCTENTVLLEFKTVDKGYYSGVTFSKNLIIEDSLIWEKLWNTHIAVTLPQPEIPEIDFSKEMVIAAFRGESPTGGYAIEIDAVEKALDKIIVHITETKPRADSVVTQALTQPYHIIQIKKTTLPVEFVYTKKEAG